MAEVGPAVATQPLSSCVFVSRVKTSGCSVVPNEPNDRDWPDSEVTAHLIDVSYQGDPGKHVLKPYPGGEQMLIVSRISRKMRRFIKQFQRYACSRFHSNRRANRSSGDHHRTPNSLDWQA